ADEERGWGLPAGTVGMEGGVPVRYNSLGLRGPEVVPREPGEERLLTLGDSSIYGQAVPEDAVFSSVAAVALSKNWHRPVTAVIGGVPGYSSTQALALLKKLGQRVSPTWVVIGTLWSDVYAGDARGMEDEKNFLRKLAFYRVSVQLLSPWLSPQKVGYMQGREDIGGQDGPPPRTSLDDYHKNLTEMVAEAKKIGARPAFIILPAPMDFDKMPPPDVVESYRNQLRELAAQESAPLLDGPALFEKAGGTVAHFGDQVHPNANGHMLLGTLLADVIGQQSPVSLQGSSP
ncbi:MAG TPA: GDSL-type esterase/lipase family protein, partial [Myxococcota bacterium]|nr:GDSL-type esterase/lipase family protein [Myxococcota bacterium]